MEVVFHEVDEAAFDVGEVCAVVDAHAVGDLDAAVADVDGGEGDAFVAQEFAGDDVGGEADVLAAGDVFLEADDAGGEGGIFWLEVVGVHDVAEDGFFPLAVGDEHEGHFGDALEGDGWLLWHQRIANLRRLRQGC